MFREDLPDQCPPAGAIAPDDMEVFRVIRSDQPSVGDFDSQARLGTVSLEGREAEFVCRAFACSVFSQIAGARKLTKLPKFKSHKFIARLRLTPDAGSVHNSSGYHWDWWISSSWDTLSCVVEVVNA